MAYPVITIAREYGSGGRMIGQRLAQNLELPFYDKELIGLAAHENGYVKNFFRKMEQKQNLSLVYNLYSNLQFLPESDQEILAQCQVIRELAEEGPCVIMGRFANYVLRKRTDCFNVFIHAPIAQRTRRACEVYGDKTPNLENAILKKDKERSSYYKYLTNQQWTDPHNYHISLDSGIGLDASVSLLTELALNFLEVYPHA